MNQLSNEIRELGEKFNAVMPHVASMFATPAILASEKLMREYLAIGITEDEARKFCEANISPYEAQQIIYRNTLLVDNMPKSTIRRPKRKLTVERLLNG